MIPHSSDQQVESILRAARQAGAAALRSRHHLSASHRYRRSGLVAITLNLTPMIDVVFLLLLFFLAASRFGTNEGMLAAHLPAHSAAISMEIPRTPIRVRFVSPADSPDRCSVTIERFNDSPLPVGELAEALKKIQQQPGFDANTPVHLMADDEVRWDHVVNAYNASLAAGYGKVFFATKR